MSCSCTCGGSVPAAAVAAAQGGGPAATDVATASAPPPGDTAAGAASATKGKAPTASATKPSQAIAGVLMIGDSLGVGTAPYLKDAFGGSTKVTSNVKGGRTLAQGMAEYDKVKDKPKVVEMGLFTNDGPNNLPALKKAVERTVADAKARGGRVVWATIQRPAVGGQSYDKVNQYLRDMARQHPDVMGLVDWKQMVDSHPGYVGGDKVHSGAAGYQARAQAFAAAARG